MTEHCYTWQELDQLLELAAEDPRRQHLSGCPLCRARLAAYRQFLAKEPLAPGSQQAEAEARLAAFIARTFRGEPGVAVKTRPPLLTRLEPILRPRRIMGPALAMAAVLALLVLLKPFPLGQRRWQGSLRSADSTASGGLSLLVGAKLDSEGIIIFQWHPWPQTGLYRVQIFTPELVEFAGFPAQSDTFLRVPLVAIRETREPLFWRIQVLRDGDEIAHSAPMALDLRRP